MALWDLAEWVGPTPNRYPGAMLAKPYGLVLHIMEGTFEGSIAWGKNPQSQVSFTFATRRVDGHIAQLVDTADGPWTQGTGNTTWLSVENEGFHTDALTAGQLEAVAQIYARGVREYGWPLKLAEFPTDRGLGWHGMGGDEWGGHYGCPGDQIKAQRPAILARADAILMGDTMSKRFVRCSDGTLWLCDLMTRRPVTQTEKDNLTAIGPRDFGETIPPAELGPYAPELLDTFGQAAVSGGPISVEVGLTPATVAEIAEAVVNEEHARLAE